jgi:hypothetical protein
MMQDGTYDKSDDRTNLHIAHFSFAFVLIASKLLIKLCFDPYQVVVRSGYIKGKPSKQPTHLFLS